MPTLHHLPLLWQLLYLECVEFNELRMKCLELDQHVLTHGGQSKEELQSMSPREEGSRDNRHLDGWAHTHEEEERQEDQVAAAVCS